MSGSCVFNVYYLETAKMPQIPSHRGSNDSMLKTVIISDVFFITSPQTLPAGRIPAGTDPTSRGWCTGTWNSRNSTLRSMLKGCSSISFDSSLPPHCLSLLPYSTVSLFWCFRQREGEKTAWLRLLSGWSNHLLGWIHVCVSSKWSTAALQLEAWLQPALTKYSWGKVSA